MEYLGKRLLHFYICLLGLKWLAMSDAAPVPSSDAAFQTAAESCESYPWTDAHLEAQGIYTGPRIPDKMLVFQVSEKSVLTPVQHPDSNETEFVRETLTVRDSCTVMEKTLTPNLTELLKEWGDDCISATPRSPREIDSEFTKKKYMAVWTFTVPAKKCFALDFFIRTRGLLDHTDKLTILDGDLILPVVLMSGRHEHLLPLRNDTSTVSVVYFYTSLSRNVYWRMAPSLRTSDCKKC